MDPNQLSFTKGEILVVVKQESSGWWAAMRCEGDCIGWIPSSFVEPLFGRTLDELQGLLSMSVGEEEILQTICDHVEFGPYPDPEGYQPWVPVYEDVKVCCDACI